jgi:hypothetical protein
VEQLTGIEDVKQPAGASDCADRRPNCAVIIRRSEVTSVPDITRLIARIEDWKGQGPAMGRADAARRLEEAHKLDEVSNMLGDVRRELLGVGKR